MTQFKKKIEILSNELKQDCLTERPDPGIFQKRIAVSLAKISFQSDE